MRLRCRTILYLDVNASGFRSAAPLQKILENQKPQVGVSSSGKNPLTLARRLSLLAWTPGTCNVGAVRAPLGTVEVSETGPEMRRLWSS